MSTFIKVQRKGAITIPSPIREALGIKEGDMIEASEQRGKVLLTPKQLVNRSRGGTKKHTRSKR